MSPPQIVFIHGFLGSPDDWNEYIDHFKNQGYDPIALRLEEILLNQIPQKISPKAHLVGYSI